MGEILIAGPGRGGGWRPAYEPSSECDLGEIGERPIVVYRMWKVRRGHRYPGDVPFADLAGTQALCPAPWREREVTAYCLSKPIAGRAGQPELFVDHDPPSPERRCTCGLSAFYDPLEHWGMRGVGAVAGRASLTDIWLRVERARVECFALGARVPQRDREFLEGLAEQWEVPVLASRELAEFGREAGREVPRLVRPRSRS